MRNFSSVPPATEVAGYDQASLRDASASALFPFPSADAKREA